MDSNVEAEEGDLPRAIQQSEPCLVSMELRFPVEPCDCVGSDRALNRCWATGMPLADLVARACLSPVSTA